MSCLGFTMNEITDKVDRIVAENKEIWKSKAMFFSFLKGLFRRGWSRHPIKIKLLKKHRKQIPNPNPKGKKPTVWGAECSVCHNVFPMNMLEVDHVLEDTASLTKLSDVQSCVEKLLVIVEDDLRIICKNDHAISTLSQRLGIPLAEAKIEQKVILFRKQNAEKQKKQLQSLGIDSIMPTSAKRVEQYRNYIKENRFDN